MMKKKLRFSRFDENKIICKAGAAKVKPYNKNYIMLNKFAFGCLLPSQKNYIKNFYVINMRLKKDLQISFQWYDHKHFFNVTKRVKFIKIIW